jgi:hypothetical protein
MNVFLPTPLFSGARGQNQQKPPRLKQLKKYIESLTVCSSRGYSQSGIARASCSTNSHPLQGVLFMNRIAVRLGVPMLVVFSTFSQAQDPKTKGDDSAIAEVVAASMEAGKKMDWKGYAELVHPESLQDYKNMWLPILQAAAQKGLDEQAGLLSLFEKGADLKSLIAMKPKQFFVSSMNGIAAQHPQVKDGIAASDSKLIGTVHEGNDLAYAVVRSRIMNTKVNKIEVITLKRSGAQWKPMLPEVIKVLAETFQRTLQSGAQKSGPVTDTIKPEK